MDKIGTFIFYGRSGSGKGTQAELLKKYLEKDNPEREVLYLQTGGRFREFIKRDTYTSGLVRDVLDEGKLLPAFLPIWVWTESLVDRFTWREHLIFDGICRRVFEAPVFDGAMKFYGREKPDIILLNVSDEWATTRLFERSRTDDTEKDIRTRLGWFESDVKPTIEFFKDNLDYSFHNINGEQTIEEVHHEIISKVF